MCGISENHLLISWLPCLVVGFANSHFSKNQFVSGLVLQYRSQQYIVKSQNKLELKTVVCITCDVHVW